jgi:pimeloyl-ACP methyl ester carboxylesterase
MDFVLIHGKGGSPDGSSFELEKLLRLDFPTASFDRPRLPHADSSVLAEDSLAYAATLPIPAAAYVIGISLGGLIAARLQESSRPDLNVICVSSPTWADGVRIQQKLPNRLALYSSFDQVIGARVSQWPELAQARDLPWLTHDTKAHKAHLVPLISAWVRANEKRQR